MKKNKIIKTVMALSSSLVLIGSIPFALTSCGSPSKSLDKITSIDEVRNFDPINYGVKKLKGIDYTDSPYTNSDTDKDMLNDFSNKIKDDLNFFKMLIFFDNFKSFFEFTLGKESSPTFQDWQETFSSKYFTSFSYELKDFSFKYREDRITKKINFILNAHSHFELEGNFLNHDTKKYTINHISFDNVYFSNEQSPCFLNSLSSFLTYSDMFSTFTQIFGSSEFNTLKLEIFDSIDGLISEERVNEIAFNSNFLPSANADIFSDIKFVEKG